ncbi:MAG: TspO/MBR family protein [Patescibacteria group bacterium]
MPRLSLPRLFLSFLFCFTAAGIGSLFTFSAIPTWYVALNKPFFNPPNWVFGPVWTILYTMMAFSLYLVWNSQTKKKEKNEGMNVFFIQLSLNALWSIVFFGLHSPLLALVIIIILWILIFKTIVIFSKISKNAGLLLVPYLAWVSFATLLNTAIAFLN